MVTVTLTKFVKEYNVWKDAEEKVIALQGNLVRTTNALVIISSSLSQFIWYSYLNIIT